MSSSSRGDVWTSSSGGVQGRNDAMRGSSDPFYIVQAEVEETVRIYSMICFVAYVSERGAEVLQSDKKQRFSVVGQLISLEFVDGFLPLSYSSTRFVQLQSTDRKYGSWKQRGSTDKVLQADILQECEGLEYMFHEIERSIDAAERNPSKYKLARSEITDRRQWLGAMKERTQSIKLAVQHEQRAPAKEVLMTTHSGRDGPATVDEKLKSAIHGENDRFITSEQAHQELIMARQDEDLDVLSHHVVRIGELGREMGQELDAQGQLLDEFGYEMQGTQTRLAAAQRKVQYVLDRAGTKGQLLIIAVLVVVLVILIVMVIS